MLALTNIDFVDITGLFKNKQPSLFSQNLRSSVVVYLCAVNLKIGFTKNSLVVILSTYCRLYLLILKALGTLDCL